MRPRRAARSMKISCSTPFSSTAARTSRGVTLIRISSPIALSLPLGCRQGQQIDARGSQQLPGLVQRQSHHAGIAALESAHEQRTEALDGITAGLVPGLASGPVLPHLSLIELPEPDPA